MNISFNLGIKCVCATDAHYTDKEDSYAYEALLAIGTKNKISDPDSMRFEGEDYHLLSADEYEEKFIPYGTEVMINNHIYIAEDCGTAIKGKRVDILYETHNEAYCHGMQQVEVFIKNN